LEKPSRTAAVVAPALLSSIHLSFDSIRTSSFLLVVFTLVAVLIQSH
jgi:hypothetical protein